LHPEDIALNLPILGVCVASPVHLGTWNGEPVTSAIRKTAVAARTITLTRLNLDGDGQADLSVHGGPDKAVYCYPATHADWWAERGVAYRAGFMGENLTVDRADEADVRIGDQFRWGPALLEVSEPRGPCFKLGLLTGLAAAPALMTQAAFCGWYLRVLEPGVVPVNGALECVASDGRAPSVREAFVAKTRPDFPAARAQEIAAWPTLAESWRGSLHRKLSRA
jgi:MOSC domain-containing protein YiiM